MGTEENKEVVRQFYEAVMNQTSPADLDPLMAEDFIDHGETLFGSPRGREILESGIDYVHGILPDLHVSLEDMIASGDMVGVRGLMRVTHTGPLAGVPATGNELRMERDRDVSGQGRQDRGALVQLGQPEHRDAARAL